MSSRSTAQPTFLLGSPARRGHPLHVAWIGRDERDADLLYRAWRAVRVKGIDDELSGVSARQQARQEALALVLAGEAGARVPTLVGVGETDEGDGLLPSPNWTASASTTSTTSA